MTLFDQSSVFVTGVNLIYFGDRKPQPKIIMDDESSSSSSSLLRCARSFVLDHHTIQYATQQRSYESLSDSPPCGCFQSCHDGGRRPRSRFFFLAGLGLALAGGGGMMILLFFPQHHRHGWKYDGTTTTNAPIIQPRAGETIPTLLSLRDDDNDDENNTDHPPLLSARTNPLYDRLKNATIVVSIVRSYSVTTSYMDHQDQPTTTTTSAAATERSVACWDLSFLADVATDEEDDDNHASTTSSSSRLLVALQCAERLGDLLSPASTTASSSSSASLPAVHVHLPKHRIYDIATISQLRTTAQMSRQCHDLLSPTNYDWSLPVPTSIRVPYCQWIVLLDKDEEEQQRVETFPATTSQKKQKRRYHRHQRQHPQQREDEPAAVGEVWTVVGVSNPLTMSTSPLNVHLAYRTDPTQLVVQFSSVRDGTPVVQVGGDLDDDESDDEGARATTRHRRRSHTRIIRGTTTSYGAADLCQAPANVTGPGQFQSPGYLHTVVLTDLPVDTAITYRVGLEMMTTDHHEATIVWRRRTHTTRTNVPAGIGGSEPYVYLVYGDQGCPVAGWEVASAWIDALVEREVNHSVRSIHHFGDLSYAQGVAHQWDAWLAMLEPATVRWPLMIAVGNHEYDYLLEHSQNDPSWATSSYHPPWGNFGLDSGGECAVPVVKRFRMPDDTGNRVFWYSYDSGLVHTIVLSSEHDLAAASDQHEWFRTDLKRVDRTLTPWLVVELHRPLYEDEAYWEQNNVGIGMRDEIEDLLVDYQVDLVLSGHYHAYHRS
jgi:hypothetical protein